MSYHNFRRSLARKGYCEATEDLLGPEVPAQNAPFYVEAAVQLIQGLGLTRRQAEVLHWTAEGKTNEDIGQILGCSIHTVKNHLKDIFRVLGVTSRTAAAACAYRGHLTGALELTAASIKGARPRSH